VKITQIEHIYDTTADFYRSKTSLLMLLQWYIKVVTAISRQCKQSLVHNFRLLGCKEIMNFGLMQTFLRLVHKQSL